MSFEQSSSVLVPCRFVRELSLGLVGSVQLLLGILMVIHIPDALRRCAALGVLFLGCAVECIAIWRESPPPNRLAFDGFGFEASWCDAGSQRFIVDGKYWLGIRFAWLVLVEQPVDLSVLLLRSQNESHWHRLASAWRMWEARENAEKIK